MQRCSGLAERACAHIHTRSIKSASARSRGGHAAGTQAPAALRRAALRKKSTDKYIRRTFVLWKSKNRLFFLDLYSEMPKKKEVSESTKIIEEG